MKFKQSIFNMSSIYASRIFDKLLEKATSSTNLEPDWNTILQVCDTIRQNDVTPKYATLAIKRKLYSENPHTVYYTLLTLESMMKNCGQDLHDEVATKTFSETLHERLKHTTNERNRNKILALIQAWSIAFRKIPKYRPIQDMANIIRAEGYSFPLYNESDAMFTAQVAPKFVTGEVCHRCRVPFSLILRRHHCRACGQPFCQQCSSNSTILPQFGIEKEVRVCESCYDKYAIASTSKIPKRTTFSFNYKHKLNPVQSAPVTKPTPGPSKQSEDLKLQEEDDLQLALALSKSEAEHKETERRTRSYSASSARRPKPSVPKLVSAISAPNTGLNSEMNHYLDRQYWEKRAAATPTAPEQSPSTNFPKPSYTKTATSDYDDVEDKEIEKFIELLRSQVEIFVNRMKSDSSRGRPIANDSSVQGLFINITAMHSRLLQYIEKVDDKRVHLESLQDKVSQVRDSRAALDLLRTEHAAHLAAVQKAAQTVKQSQMAAKLQTLRQKKHEYLQYQRHLALQRVQEHERELQMRQEQLKQQSGVQENNYLFSASVNQLPNTYINRTLQGNPSWRANNITPMATDLVQNTQPTLSNVNLARAYSQKDRIPCTTQFSNSINCVKQSYKETKIQPQGSVSQTLSQPNVRSTLPQQVQNQDTLTQQMQWVPCHQGHQVSQNINGHQNRNISMCQQNETLSHQEQTRNQNMLQNYSQSINNNFIKSYNPPTGIQNNSVPINQQQNPSYSLDVLNQQINQYNPMQSLNLQQPSQNIRLPEQASLPANPNQLLQNQMISIPNNFQFKTATDCQRQIVREQQNMNIVPQSFETSTNLQPKVDSQAMNSFHPNVIQHDMQGNYQIMPSPHFISLTLDTTNAQNHIQHTLQPADVTNLESILKNNKISSKMNQRTLASHQNSATQQQNLYSLNLTNQGNPNLQQYQQNNTNAMNQLKPNIHQNLQSLSQTNQQIHNQPMISNSQANQQTYSQQMIPVTQLNQQSVTQQMVPITQGNQQNHTPQIVSISQNNQQNHAQQMVSNNQSTQQNLNQQMVQNNQINQQNLNQQMIQNSQMNQPAMQTNQSAQGYATQTSLMNNQYADHGQVTFNQTKLSFLPDSSVSQGQQNIGVSTQQDHARSQNRLTFLQPQAQVSQSEQHSIPKLQQMQSNGMPPILQILNNAQEPSTDQTSQVNTNHQSRQLTGILMNQQKDPNSSELQKDKSQIAQSMVDPNQMQNADKSQNQQFYQASATGLQQQIAQVISRPQKSASQVQFQSQHMINFQNHDQPNINNNAGMQNGVLTIQQLPVKHDQNNSPNPPNNS